MDNTGWNFPGTVTTDAGNAGLAAWANPENVKLENGVYSIVDALKHDGHLPEDGSNLKASNFGFTIPDNAIITGIELKTHGYTNGNLAGDVAYLTQLGSPILYGKEKTDDWVMQILTSTYTYGNENDLWGTDDLTPAIINSTNFGWVFMVYDSAAPINCGVDYMQMRVHYETHNVALMMGDNF